MQDRNRTTPGRRRLIRAGMKLMAEKGYAGTPLRDIASEAGVSLGLIRVHFGSKAGLRQAIDGFALEEIRGLYDTIREHSGADVMSSVVEDAESFIRKDRDVLMYLRMAILEKTPGSLALLKNLQEVTKQHVEKSAKQGVLQAGVDQHWMSIYLLFDMIGPMMLEPFAKDLFGESMYDIGCVRERQRFYRHLITRGVYKPGKG